MAQTLRTFVAVEAGSEIRARAEKLIAKLGAAGADVKWVEPHNIHLTLKFLGDVDLRETARVCRALQEAATQIESFEIEIRGVGAFPHPGKPRTVWIGAGEGQERMQTLHRSVEEALGKLGFRNDARQFRTHLTIGRVRHGGPGVSELGQRIRQYADFQAGRMTVKELVVFSSTLSSTGPTYEALGRATLHHRRPASK